MRDRACGPLFAALLLWAAGALAGCSPLYGDFDAAPAFRTIEGLPTGVRESDALGPFVERRATEEVSVTSVRPLVTVRERPFAEGPGRERVVSFLPPFGKSVRNPRVTRWRFWPLVWYENERTGPGGRDWDFLLFPILFLGASTPPPSALAAGEEPERYFALFPLAGEIHSFVGYDKFRFLLWPILQQVTKRVYDEDEETFTSIALLVGWTRGAPRGGSWHVLPFFYKSQWTYPPYRAPHYPEGADPSKPLPRYVKWSFLWPFVHWQRLDMDRGPGRETRLFGIWPFFKHEVGIDHEFWTLLWPFFRYNREYPLRRESYRAKHHVPADADPEAPENTNVLVDFLTQLVWRYERTQEYRRRRILTFLYADYESLPRDVRERRSGDRIESTAFLQPIGFWKRKVEKLGPAGGYRDDSIFALVPFFQTHKRTYLDPNGRPDGRTDRFTRLWPVFSYERDADGRRDVQLVPILPLRIEKYTLDFTEAFGPFFEFYRYRRDPDVLGGTTYHDALFRLIKVRSNERETSVSVPLLFSWRGGTDESGRDRSRLSFLAGAFGWEKARGPGGPRTVIRLFGIPFGGNSEESVEAPAR